MLSEYGEDVARYHMQTVLGADFYKRAVPVARHYGFLPLEEAVRHEVDLLPDPAAARAKALALRTQQQDRAKVVLDGNLRHYEQGMVRLFGAGLLPRREPLLYFTSSSTRRKGGGVTLALGLHAVGSRQSIAEALILRTALSTLEELGVRALTLRVNGVGDRDSLLRYMRDASVFLKRRFTELPPHIQSTAREDAHRAIVALASRRDALARELPRPVEYLTTPSRRHLREVLEFIESTGTSYELDDLLMGPRECYSHLLYEFDATTADGAIVRVAQGGRYDELSRNLFRVGTPAVGLVIEFAAQERTQGDIIAQVLRAHKPRVCLVNVGAEARIKSFRVIETFRKAHISVEQCFKYERLSDQLAFAERINTPFVVIIGQKEALEGVAIVRNAATRAQQTVAVDRLAVFLREKTR